MKKFCFIIAVVAIALCSTAIVSCSNDKKETTEQQAPKQKTTEDLIKEFGSVMAAGRNAMKNDSVAKFEELSKKAEELSKELQKCTLTESQQALFAKMMKISK